MRPNFIHVGGVFYWTIQTRNPDTQVLKDADSTPTVAVRKNGASTGDSVTITKRSATTGLYDCSYNPAGDAEGDVYQFEESATVTGTTTSSATYNYTWTGRVVAVERGTDSALTTLGANAPAAWLNTAAFADGAITAAKIADNLITAAKIANDALTAAKFAASSLNDKGNWAKAGDQMALIDGAIAAIKIAASALNGKGDWLLSSSYTAPDNVGIGVAAAAAASAATSAASAATNSADAVTNTTSILNKLGAITGSGVNTVLGFFKAIASKVATLPSDIGGTFDPAADSLEAIRDRGDAAWITGSGGSGSGARTITITVNDGTTNLQNATVTLTEGANAYTATTNVSGVATLNVDDATYTVAITKSGYSFAGASLLVNGDEVQTYSMSAISITPGTGDFTTGYLTCYDETGTVEAAATVYCELTAPPSGDTGYSYDSKIRTLTSAANGLVEIPGLVKGGTYRIWRGQRKANASNQYLIPTSAGSTYELPSHIGRE